tara:strand:+ start:3319 stop:4044 length:726 start_codon:yes stop_codon:yes gene_type:complete
MNGFQLILSFLAGYRLLILSCSVVFVLAFPGFALAHEGRMVGNLKFDVGFLNEPALEGEQNAVYLRLTKIVEDPAHVHSHAHDDAKGDGHHQVEEPVKRIQSKLEVQVTHIESSVSQSMRLTPIINRPGSYQSVFIPTAPGAYRFRFLGEVDGVNIDESFESGQGTFDTVVGLKDVQFPLKIASSREIEGVTRATRDAARVATTDAAEARSLAIGALAVGGLGLIVAGIGLGYVMKGMNKK